MRSDIKAIKSFILQTAGYYNRSLSDEQLVAYAEDLSEFEIGDLLSAFKNYRTNPKNVHFPLPAQLIGILRPRVTDETESVEASARIISAIRRIGYTSPERARDYIGELGWEVVRLCGGWTYLCETMTPDRENTFRAQCREIAKTQLHRHAAGVGNEAPKLRLSEGNSITESLGILASSKDLNQLIKLPK